MVPGELVTVPLPEFVTVRVYEDNGAKVAVTFLAAFISTVHWFPFTESQPDQPVKVPRVGVAINVTGSPATKVLLHWEPQFMPAGELVIVPVPVPDLFTLRVYKSRLNGS
jgi:hypothetical protein